jgi:hypothetical protein
MAPPMAKKTNNPTMGRRRFITARSMARQRWLTPGDGPPMTAR